MRPSDFPILRNGDAVPAFLKEGIVAIGNFDGVHRGHQAVLKRAIAIAGEQGSAALALTFEPHPRSFFRPHEPVFRLTPPDVKARLMAALGLAGMIEMRFDAALAALAAESFVEEVLVRRLAVRVVVVGSDFHFGRGREGSPTRLAELGAKHGFGVAVVEPQGEGDVVFSSSEARALLAQGRVREAADMLGYVWFARGTVITGARRGRTLGFPTANVKLAENFGLRHGVYAVRGRMDGRSVGGVASFGRRPQFDDGAPLLETYFFDFTDDLYGETIEIEFVDFLRPEARFESVDALIAQMGRDADEARKILAIESSHPPPSSALAEALSQ